MKYLRYEDAMRQAVMIDPAIDTALENAKARWKDEIKDEYDFELGFWEGTGFGRRKTLMATMSKGSK